MEETLVSFELAVLANEIGFQEPTTMFYCERFGLCYEEDEMLIIIKDPETGKTSVRYDVNNEFEEGIRHRAPTLSLLQKWIREEKSKNVFCLPNRYDGTQWYYVVGSEIISYENTEWSYEKALEEGLKIAIESLKEFNKKYLTIS